MTPTPADVWPYPRWVAHRGAGKLAPENTLAAFKLGAREGYRMFECDVKLSSDRVPFLLHDDMVERTTNGQGVAGQLTWQALQKLDAGNWHSAAYKGEPLPSLDTIADYCISNGFDLNIEIKPTTGTDAHTGNFHSFPGQKHLLSEFSSATLQQRASAFQLGDGLRHRATALV